MSDYIRREDAYRRLTKYYHHTRETQHESLRIALIGIPSADVAIVRHGKWDADMSGLWCSVCGGYSEAAWNYCPYCGARMDLLVSGAAADNRKDG